MHFPTILTLLTLFLAPFTEAVYFKLMLRRYAGPGCQGRLIGIDKVRSRGCKTFKEGFFRSISSEQLTRLAPQRRCNLLIYTNKNCKGPKWRSKDLSKGNHCMNIRGQSVIIECTLKALPIPHMIMDGEGYFSIITTPPAPDATVVFNKRAVELQAPAVSANHNPYYVEGWEGADDNLEGRCMNVEDEGECEEIGDAEDDEDDEERDGELDGQTKGNSP
ncbi:hypothetical protein K470DRAFT_8619 [Piedraia hortae CBS 480.64]|uniref:Uncharacterized protein n=1 Tax=Piedraia hortae CBS 480.64 TaxID=1314780 RepID=A0A6A7C6L7_9PEZI|nr:hypothetical protein K470DRAFT_8619 [Piedraia hortae CBS 480.64]